METATDTLQGGYQTDTMNGGAGIDIADYFDHYRTVKADLDGQPSDDGSSGERDTIAADVEGLRGSAGKDKLIGNANANTIDGFQGDDKIFGGPTATAADTGDILNGGLGRDKIYGRKGDDTIDGGYEDDIVYGDDGDDVLTAGTGRNQLLGGAGNDSLTSVVGGIDRLNGGTGNDALHSADGDGLDQITCGTGLNFGEADAGRPVQGPRQLRLGHALDKDARRAGCGWMSRRPPDGDSSGTCPISRSSPGAGQLESRCQSIVGRP